MSLKKKIKKVINFLGLGIPKKIEEYFTPKLPAKKALRIQRQGSSLPIPVIYGTQLVGGIVVHKYVTDGSTKNRFLNVIVVFCEGEIDDIEEFFFNGVSWQDKRFRDDRSGNYWFESSYLRGTPAQSSTLPIDNIPNWTDNHNLNGLAWAYFRFEQDKDQTIWNGEPKITARIRGRKLFDPRTNSTAYSDNPALCLRDYLTNPIYGKNIPESRIDDAAFINAANNCDTIIDSVERTITESFYDENEKKYVTEPTRTEIVNITKHTCNVTIDTGVTVFENVKILLNTFRGLLPPKFILGPIIEEAGSPTFTFDDDNITSDVVIKSPDLNQRYNRVTVKFPNELSPTYDDDEAFWPAASDPVYQTFLNEDNGKILEKTFDFNGINNMAEAQQMAEFLCKKSRFQLSLSIDALPVSNQVEVGDIVGLTNLDNGYTNKPFRVKSKIALSNNEFRFELLEHENNIYPWEGKSYEEVDGGTWLGDPGDVGVVENLTFTKDLSLSSTGTLNWKADENSFIDGYIVETRIVADENGDKPVNESGQEVDFIITDRVDTVSESYTIPILVKSTYQFFIYIRSTVGSTGLPSSIQVLIDNPTAPSGISFEADNFEIRASAFFNIEQGIGTSFQFAINNVTNPSEPTGSITFVNLSPETTYTIFARSVNAYGVSPWISQEVQTLKDGSRIVEVIGDDISQVILPDVIEAVQDDLDQIVIDSLVDYPTKIEVTNEINSSIELINNAFNEDPRLTPIEVINNILDNYETEGNVKTESLERKTQVNSLQTDINGNTASIVEINTVVSDLDSSVAAQFTAIQTRVGDNESSIVEINLSVSDLESSVAQQFTQIQASVDGNAASITSVSTALATETTTRATQVSQLQATDNNIISQINQVESDIEGNFSSISSIQATIDNPITGLSATYGLAQSAESKADGNTTSITTLTNKVEDPDSGLSATFNLASQAKITADGNTTSITTLTNKVEDPDNGLTATFNLASQAKITADGNTTSLTLLTNKVEDPDNGLTATFNLASQAKITADGNTTSIAGLDTRVTDTEGTANAALTLSSSIDSSLNEYRASAQLKVDAQGNAGFIQLDATPSVTQIRFESDQFILQQNGVPKVFFDNSQSQYKFIGIGDFTVVNSPIIDSQDITATNAILTKNISISGRCITDFVVDAGKQITAQKVECTEFDGTRFVGRDLNLSGTTTNARALIVNTGAGDGVDAASTGGGFAFYASQGGYGPFTGSHEGLVKKGFKAEPGDLICDGDLIHIADVSNAILESKISTMKNDASISGAFVSLKKLDIEKLPSGLRGFKGDLSNYDIITFNSIGEGVINVCGENGNIKAGDYICSSSLTGKGMKQVNNTMKNYTIAKARHSVSFKGNETKQLAVKYLGG